MAEFFFDPNIAYLLLVLTSLVMLASVLSPGTGFIELSALSLMVLTGWVIYNSSINPIALVLLVVGFVPFWLAVRRSGKRWYLWAAIGLFVVGSSFLFTRPDSWMPAVNPVLGVGVSALVSLFLWWAARRTIEVMLSTPVHDLGRILRRANDPGCPAACKLFILRRPYSYLYVRLHVRRASLCMGLPCRLGYCCAF
ncbi:MAG: hypothetical protein MUC85_10585 [Anaerolineales bacterium]|nr:hypothetical protein [Anaerolineales bacterium]